MTDWFPDQITYGSFLLFNQHSFHQEEDFKKKADDDADH